MRYSTGESTILAGILPTGETVSIKVVEMKTDTLIPLANDACAESTNAQGVYLWDTTNITQTFTQRTDLMYVMTAQPSGKTFYGKFVVGGIYDDLQQAITTANGKLNTILDIEQGTWEIKNEQMIFYAVDGSELMRFNLYDKNGQPTSTAVFKRERV